MPVETPVSAAQPEMFKAETIQADTIQVNLRADIQEPERPDPLVLDDILGPPAGIEVAAGSSSSIAASAEADILAQAVETTPPANVDDAQPEMEWPQDVAPRVNLKIERTTEDDPGAPSEDEPENNQDDIDALFDTPSAADFGSAEDPEPEPEEMIRKSGKAAELVAGASAVGALIAGHARKGRSGIASAASKKKGMLSRLPVAASLALLLFGGIGFGVIKRESVVATLPQTAKLFAMIGLPVNLRGLEIQNVTSKIVAEQGVSQLVIEGDIVNVTKRDAKLSRLRFAIRSENGREIYSWKAPADKPALEPGETLHFKRRLASPPEESRDIVVRFETRGDMVAGVQ